MTPQRPTFSSDTSTTAVGSFELEAGAVVDPGDFFALPMSLKYGISDNAEMNVTLSPFNVIDFDSGEERGVSDTVVGVRHRFWESEGGTSAALQVGTKLPTGDDDKGLGSGEIDFGAAAILTSAIGDSSAVTAYCEYIAIGDPSGPGVNSGNIIALAASRSFDDGLGVFLELAQLVGPRGDDPLIATFGLAKSIAPSILFDLGAAVGLNGDATDVLILAGVTINLGPAAR